MKALTPNELTARQKDIFDWLVGKIRDVGICPTIREIMTQFDIKSPNGVVCHLRALSKKGYLKRWRSGASRSLRPSGEGKALSVTENHCTVSLRLRGAEIAALTAGEAASLGRALLEAARTTGG